MNRRSFLQNTIVAIGGSLLVGKTETQQIPLEKERLQAGIQVQIDDYGNLVFPAFFTVFVDGIESFRMVPGDTITAERTCHIVAYNDFESTPSMNLYLTPGDTLTVDN